MNRHFNAAEMGKINRYFPNLSCTGSTVEGEIQFSARYERLETKNACWRIASCNSGPDCIQDVYEIEIRLNTIREGKPAVFETGRRIERLAKELEKPMIDFHIYPNGGDCCLGLYLPNPKETLSEFVINKVYPFFVWQAYYEKHRKIPPCGEYPHDEQGLHKFIRHLANTGRNESCPCGSNLKFKKCCKDMVDKYLRKESDFRLKMPSIYTRFTNV